MRPATDAISPVATWEDWWHFNKDPFLDLKRAVGTGGPATAADEIVSGKPRASPSVPGAVRSRVVPALRALVETEKSTEVVGGSMIALARADDGGSDEATERTIPLLVKRLADSSQEIAETAALSLGILGSEESLPILEALVLNGPAGRKLVGEHDVSDRTRAFAAYGLGLVAHQSATNRGRQLAARALCAAIEGTRASAPDVEIAAVIALSLGPLDAERAPSSSAPWISRQTEVRFLQKIVADPRRRSLVRAHAVTALARLAQGAPPELAADVVEQLLGLLRAHAKLENEVLQSCAQALGLLGDADGDLLDRKIRSALGTLLDDPDSQTRCFALVALAQVGSRPSASGAGGEEEGSLVCRNLITGEIVRGRGQTRPWAAIALGVLERRIQDRIGTGAGGDDAIVSGARSGLTPSKGLARDPAQVLRERQAAHAHRRGRAGARAVPRPEGGADPDRAPARDDRGPGTGQGRAGARHDRLAGRGRAALGGREVVEVPARAPRGSRDGARARGEQADLRRDGRAPDARAGTGGAGVVRERARPHRRRARDRSAARHGRAAGADELGARVRGGGARAGRGRGSPAVVVGDLDGPELPGARRDADRGRRVGAARDPVADRGAPPRGVSAGV
jgi:HEAT repeat protein